MKLLLSLFICGPTFLASAKRYRYAGKPWSPYEPWNDQIMQAAQKRSFPDPEAKLLQGEANQQATPSARYVAWKENHKMQDHPKPENLAEPLPEYCRQIPEILSIPEESLNNYIYEHLTVYKSVRKGGDQHFMRASPLSCKEDGRQFKILKNGKRRGFVPKAKHRGIIMCDSHLEEWKVIEDIASACSLDPVWHW